MTARRCVCGYPREFHEVVTARCPGLERSKFRDQPPAEVLRVRPDGIRVPVMESGPEMASPVAGPLVPARYTRVPSEVAKAALKLGFLAQDRGWRVDPWYWQAADGTETSALVMLRAELRAFAAWHRKIDGTWKTGGALAWRDGALPVRVGVTALAGFMQEM